jgi:L-fucose isomerase-like protein
LYKEEHRDLYVSPNIIRVIKPRIMRWARHVASVRDMRNAKMVLVGKPDRKRPLGKPTSRWKNSIKIDLK